MLYNLNTITDRERFKRRSNELYKKGVTVELTEKTLRSKSQNSYLHLILGWYAMETGNQLDFVKDAYFKKLCNKEIFISVKTDKYLGSVEIVRSSRECTTAEMTTAIERFRNWSASECEIYLPSPDEREFLQSIEVELSKNSFYV